MFVIKKLITPFLLPPGAFILILLLSGLWFLRRKNRTTAYWFIAIGSLFWMLSSGLMSHWIMSKLESGLPLPVEVNADVIIMLGGGVYAESPDMSGIGAPGPGTMERMVTAARLSRRWELPIIVSGGKVFDHSGSIARISKRFLVDLGIPPDLIFTEDRSRDTLENARYSAQICKQQGFTRPILVTSAYHMKRARFSFDRAGLPAIAYPCAFTTWKKKQLNFWYVLPTSKALNATTSALHEILGILFYRWRHG